jgi:hypothetical protein
MRRSEDIYWLRKAALCASMARKNAGPSGNYQSRQHNLLWMDEGLRRAESVARVRSRQARFISAELSRAFKPLKTGAKLPGDADVGRKAGCN